MDNLETQTTLGTQDTGPTNVTENLRNIKYGQSRDTDNIEYTRHKTNKRDRKPRKHQVWTIYRHIQHWANKTHDKLM